MVLPQQFRFRFTVVAHGDPYPRADWILMKSFGSMYCWYRDASRISRCDDASTMLRTVKRLIALSFGTYRFSVTFCPACQFGSTPWIPPEMDGVSIKLHILDYSRNCD